MTITTSNGTTVAIKVLTARAEAAESELVTLRAKLAAVEAEKEAILGQVDQAARMLRLTGAIAASQTVIAQVRRWPQFVDAAALATTGEGECSNCRQPLTAEPCSQPDGKGGKVTGHWVAGGPCEAQR